MKAPTLILLLTLHASLTHAATFGGLGDLPGGAFNSAANAVSADGSVIVGASQSAAGYEGFRWTLESGIVGLGDLPGGSFSSPASRVSADGLTIVGSSVSASGPEAFRWTSATGITGLGDLPGGSFQSGALGVSADGSTIVGYGVTTAGFGEIGQRAVRWVSGGSPASLASTDYSYANAVSSDGLTIVGRLNTGDNQAFRWTLATGMVGLGYLPGGYSYSDALSISANGSVIVGQAFHSVSSESEAFSWTEATGLVGLGDLPGGTFYSYAWDASSDGSLIVGTGRSATGDEAFLWDSAHGMRNLRDVLISDYGVTNLTGWTLSAARGISADGQTIVGDGINPSGQTEAWRVTGVPEPSSALLLLSGSLLLLLRRSLRTHYTSVFFILTIV